MVCDRGISLLVVIPVFNDWKSLSLLLTELDRSFTVAGQACSVLVVDDASTVQVPSEYLLESYEAIQAVDILELRRNLGHQRAIAIGLAYAEANLQHDAVLVMDGDGEDTPTEALRLIDKCCEEKMQKIVFARRSQRSESPAFQAFYAIYRLLYRILTGQTINFGNFSIIPAEPLHRLAAVSELWNHYAAGVMRSRVPWTDIPTKRGYRLYGKSKMNFASLVIHGLSAISVFSEIIGVRLLFFSALLILMSAFSICTIVLVRLTTNWAIPGWASSIGILLAVFLIQTVILSLMFIFIILAGRNNYSFVPQRDFRFYVLRVHHLLKCT